jgi:hypothetical protein
MDISTSLLRENRLTSQALLQYPASFETQAVFSVSEFAGPTRLLFHDDYYFPFMFLYEASI